MNTNKLQFLHHSSPFQTVDEAKGYVLNLIGDGSLRLAIGEPLVLVYGQTDDLSAIIGIGTKEDGTGVFFIDQDADVANIRRIKTILTNVVSSCGFDENGRLKPFSGEIISGSNNVEDAIEELASHIKAMSLTVSDTKTVDLTLANRHGESGLTADVRVPRTIMMGGNILTNTLQVGDDGLYAYVDIAHTLGTNKFKMTINDQVKEIDLEDTVKNGVYDNAMKSIVLTLNNNNKVYINLQEIFNEFKASNIVCWLPGGEKSNLQSVVSSGGVVSNFESANETNIIRSVGGLFASVNLTYNPLTNTLVFTKSDKDEISKVTEIQLNSASVLDHIYYDRTKEELVLIYHTTDGQRQEVRIPISDLFEEWYTDNSNSTVTLVKDRSVQGYTSLKGNVNVAPLSLVPHNILQEFHNAGFHGLSVNGVAENIAYGNGTVKDALDTMSVDLAAEIAARENADNALQNALVAETNARTQTDTELRNAIVAEINERERVDAGLSNAIQAEIVARENADNELRGLISAETAARENADSALRTDLDTEIIARQSGDTVNAQAIGAEENRAKTEENRLAQLISAETEARVAGDDALRGLVTDEISARTSAYTELRNAISVETTARIAGDSALSGAISAETVARISGDSALSGAISAETAARISGDSALSGAISTETATRISSDSALSGAIETETEARISGDSALSGAISTETEARISSDSVLSGAIETETEARISGDSALSGAISTETEARISSDSVLSGAISAETAARENADNEIWDAISAETAALNGAISTETAARIAGDSALSDAIEAEESRARDREDELEDIINRNKVIIKVPEEEVYLQKYFDKSASGAVYTLSTSGIASQSALSTEVAERTANDTALSNSLATAFGKIDELNQTIRGAQLEVSGDSVINAQVESDGPLVKTIYINANIDPDAHNIVQKTDNGLFATVQLTYNETTNTLTFDNGILDPTQIHLMGGSLISGITYDSSTNSLVIVYEVTTESGTSVEEVSIPVSDFFKPMVPDNSGRTATVVTGTTPDGNQSVGVNVNIYQDTNNMLETRAGHGGTLYLFVDGQPINTISGKVDGLEAQVESLSGLAEDVEALSGVVDDKQDKDFVIHMVKTGSTQTDISADTSLADAFSAAEAGKNVVVEYTGQAQPKMRLNLCHWSVSMVSAMTFGTTSLEMNGKTAYTGIYWFNNNYDIISEVYTEIQEPLSAGTGIDITNNVVSLTAQTGGNYSGASGVTLERDGVTFRGVISRRSEPYLKLESEGFLLSGVTSAITAAKGEAIASAKNYANSAISSAISSGNFAHLNKVGALATGEEQRLVLPWVDSRGLPSSGTVYNTETRQIETYSHGENIFAESPSENVVYCRVSDNTLWRWNGTTMVQISTGGGGGTDIHVSGVTVVTVSNGRDNEGDTVQESNGIYLKTVFENSSNKIYTPLSGVVTFQNSETVTFNVTSGNVVTAQIGDANGVVDCGDYYPVSNMVYEPETPDITGATQHTGATEFTGTTTGGTLNPSQPVNP